MSITEVKNTVKCWSTTAALRHDKSFNNKKENFISVVLFKGSQTVR